MYLTSVLVVCTVVVGGFCRYSKAACAVVRSPSPAKAAETRSAFLCRSPETVTERPDMPIHPKQNVARLGQPRLA